MPEIAPDEITIDDPEIVAMANDLAAALGGTPEAAVHHALTRYAASLGLRDADNNIVLA